MIVCHCTGLSDTKIRQACAEGAQSVGAVHRHFSIAKRSLCGGCDIGAMVKAARPGAAVKPCLPQLEDTVRACG